MKHLLTSAITLCCLYTSAQLTQAWTNVLNGQGDFTDKFKVVTTDAAGNFYAAGYTNTSGNHDYLTVKFNTQGDTVWTRTYSGLANSEDEVNAIAVDASGNVYITGYADNDDSGDDFVTIKYSSNGTALWINVYNSPFNRDDEANSLALDASGNVYVTGEIQIDANELNEDYCTIKYNAAGNQQWIKTYDGPGNATDRAIRVVTDASGNAIVTGRSDNGDNDDWITIKYNSSNGNAIWTNVLDYTENDRPEDMVIDAAGNTYITGRARSSPVNYDIATRKIDEFGNTLWTKFYGGSVDDRGKAITVDANGNVFVAGIIGVSSVANDVVTLKYNSAGTQQWFKTLNGSGNGNDDVFDIVTPATGEAIITGQTDSDASSNVNYDAFTIRYDASENIVYSNIFNGTGNGEDDARALVLSTGGAVIVAGGSFTSATNMDAYVMKYNNTGSQDWVSYVNGSGDNNDGLVKIALNAGVLAVAGYSVERNQDKNFAVRRIDASGNTVWTNIQTGSSGVSPDEASDVTVDVSGNVYATGYVRDFEQSFNYLTIKYSSSGNILWQKKYNYIDGSDRAVAVETDAQGNVYVTGRSNGSTTDTSNFDIVTIKYDANGNQLWDVRYNSGSTADEPIDLKVSLAGNVYVTGRTLTGSNENIVTIKYNSNGNQQWVKTYDAGKDDRNEAMLLDASENIYVAGRTEDANGVFDALLLKYTAAGVEVFAKTYQGSAGGEDRFNTIAFNGTSIIVAGKTDPDTDTTTDNFDMLIVEYDASGNTIWDTAWSFSATSDETVSAIASDNAGGILVTGESNRGTTFYDYTTLSFNSNRQLTGTAFYTQGSGDSRSYSIATDGGAVYVTGTSEGNNTTNDGVTVKYDLGTALSNLTNESIYAYPNPFGNFITVTCSQAQITKAEITDPLGNVVFVKEVTGENIFTLSDLQLSAGAYILQLKTLDGTVAGVKTIFAR